MENWNKQLHNFGNLTKGNTYKTHFEYLGSKSIKEIEPLCSCVKYKFNENKLTVNWTIKNGIASNYVSNKIIMITYQDDTVDDLTVTGFVI